MKDWTIAITDAHLVTDGGVVVTTGSVYPTESTVSGGQVQIKDGFVLAVEFYPRFDARVMNSSVFSSVYTLVKFMELKKFSILRPVASVDRPII